MKTSLLTIAILSCSIFHTSTSIAQKPKTGCNDVGIKNQGESIKTGLQKQGMKLYQEAMINMESMMPAPIVVKLTGGQNYQFIFVGDQDADRMMLELYDGRDKKVDEKNVKGGSNQIVYSYTPPKTDAYLFTITQKKRGRDNMCGYFGVMGYEVNVKSKPTTPTPVTKTTQQQPVRTTTTTTRSTVSPQQKTWQTAPADPKQRPKPDYEQKPNPNRTKATQEYLDQKKQGQQ